MIYAPRFTLRAFDALAESTKQEVLEHLLEALVRVNGVWLRTHRDTPALYASGVKYEQEPIGRDDWQDIPQTLAARRGDCEDLGCWRVAELRASGELTARPWVKRTSVGPHIVYHVQVRRADGRIEDPSRILGMGSAG